MNDYELVLFLWITILTIVFIYFVIDMIHRTGRIKDTVINLESCIDVTLYPQIKRIRQLVTDEIINKKENTSINKEEQNPDWMYSIFNKDKIMGWKKQEMTTEEKQKFKEYMKDYTEAQIIGWMSAMSFILLMDETTKKLRDELFDMLNICIDVIKEEGYDKGCEVKAENDDMEAMLEHLWDDTADEESED